MLHNIDRNGLWQGRRESNPQPTVLETGTLPIELLPYVYNRKRLLTDESHYTTLHIVSSMAIKTKQLIDKKNGGAHTANDSMITQFKEVCFAEDDIASHPQLYHRNGSRRIESVYIGDQNIMKAILGIAEKKVKLENCMYLSILWNLPRKQYDEINQWVCLSGVLYQSNKIFAPNCFVVSDNLYDVESQQRSIQIIDVLNAAIAEGNRKIHLDVEL